MLPRALQPPPGGLKTALQSPSAASKRPLRALQRSQDASQRPEHTFQKPQKHSRRGMQRDPRYSSTSSSDLEEISRMSKSLVGKHPLRTSKGQAAVGVARKSGPAPLARKPFETSAVMLSDLHSASAMHLHVQSICNARHRSYASMALKHHL